MMTGPSWSEVPLDGMALTKDNTRKWKIMVDSVKEETENAVVTEAWKIIEEEKSKKLWKNSK